MSNIDNLTLPVSTICEAKGSCDDPAVLMEYRRGRRFPVCARHAGWVPSGPVRLIHRLNPLHAHKCPCGAGHGRAAEACGPCRCGAPRYGYLPG